VHELEPGDEIGGLRVVRELGRGGFGRVYLALDPLIARQVAIKVIPDNGAQPGSDEYDQILVEARAIGGLNHDNIVVLYRVLPPEQCGAWLLEMEYVAGGTLGELLEREGRLDPARAESILDQLADALDYAHRQGIVHGDVKPRNVMLTPEGRVKLTDFGLARLVGDASTSLDLGGLFQGTAHYAAPELAMGAMATAASDLWGLGVVLYQMISGHLPFPSSDLAQLFHEIQNVPPPPLPAGIPDHLVRAVDTLLSKSQGQRKLLPSERRAPAAQRREAAPEEVLARPDIVGRETERAALTAWLLGEAEQQSRPLCVLSGEAGAGKTTLGRWVAAEAQRGGRSVLTVHANSLEGLLRPLLRTMRDRIAATPAGSESHRLRSVSDTLRSMLDQRPSAPWSKPQDAHWAIEQALRELGAARPLLVWLEDAHHLSREDIAMVLHLARHVDGAVARTLVTLRTHVPGDEAPAGPLRLLHELETAPVSTPLPLGPMAAEDQHELLRITLDATAVERRLSQSLSAIAGGNPLYLIELARHLDRSGGIRRQNRRVSLKGRRAVSALPARLRDLMALRLLPLSDEDRELLDTAAVVGPEFEAEDVAAVLERRLIDVLRAFQRLYRDRDLVTALDQGYRFSHALLRETIYADLAPTLRAELHRLLAEYYEKHVPGPRSPAARLAMHWEGAGRPERAWPYLIRAAVAAAQQQETWRATDFAERANLRPENISEEQALTHGEALLVIAGAYSDAGMPERALGPLDRLVEVAESHGKDALALRARVRRAGIRHRVHGLAEDELASLREEVKALPVGIDRGRAEYTLGLAAKYAGRLDEAYEHAERSRDCFFEAGLVAPGASAINMLASIHQRRGELGPAARLYEEAAQLSEKVGHRLNATISRINHAQVAFENGEIESLVPRLRALIREIDVAGAPILSAQARTILAEVHSARGESTPARRALEEALSSIDQKAYPMAAAVVLVAAANMRIGTGDLAGAVRILERARERAERGGNRRSLLRCDLKRAHVAALAGSFDDAREFLARVDRELVREPDALFEEERVEQAAVFVLLGLPPDGTRGAPSAPSGRAELAAAAAALLAEGEDRLPRLRDAARALRSRRRGRERFAREGWAHLLDWAAAREEGRDDDARTAAEALLAAGEMLDDVWMTARARRCLGRPFTEDELAGRATLPDGAQAAIVFRLWCRADAPAHGSE